MKRCKSCGQILAQSIKTCPACGSTQVAGITAIDDYRITSIIHEGQSSLVCRALKPGHKKPVTIRLFTDRSGVDTVIAHRLENELETLAKLPEDLFVQHYAIRKSSRGFWYRVSEWVDADNWSSIFVSGRLKDQRRMVTLFYNIASALNYLHAHSHFMPFLILDDILLPRDRAGSMAVKINYKLSRFLNPGAGASHHGPMLNKLLECHPDIRNERAIDFKTGIWSLGKIYVELLTADPNITRFSSKLDEMIGLDSDLTVLIKVMLSRDPDLRPVSMAKVVETLARILEKLPSAPIQLSKKSPSKKQIKQIREIAWLRRTVMMLLIIIVGIVAANTYIRISRPPDREGAGLMKLIESHTRSVGFLVVEYWIRHKNKIIYRNKVEGTAFLVDEQGYLFTNRHVACPWLDDTTVFRIKDSLSEDLDLNHRMFLWFEGAKAFNRFPRMDESQDLADAYYLPDAFSSGGKSNLRVVGVPRGTTSFQTRLHPPFQNDFAVLKIDILPKNISPLPLAAHQVPGDIRRLSPVIIMGFPLGSRTQEERINASITQGHVRRTSRKIIQVDSSIYRGNSGGPAVDDQGRIIGIATGVVTDETRIIQRLRLPLLTPLSDFGLVLHIAEPARFMESLKAGNPKWDGSLDLTLEKKLNQVVELADAQDYDGAARMTRKFLKTGRDPALIFTAAVMDFCAHDLDAAREGFTRLLSIEADNSTSRLMLLIIDRLTGKDKSRHLTRELFSMAWDHPDEYMGYLAGLLDDTSLSIQEIPGYENRYEHSWQTFIQGLRHEIRNALAMAMAAYREVVFKAGANNHLYFTAFSRLNRLLDQQGAFTQNKAEHESEKTGLWARAKQMRTKAKADYDRAVGLIQKLEFEKIPRPEKSAAYDALLEFAPANRTIIGRAAFFHAQGSEWEEAISYIDRYFSTPVRETALGLSLGLLKGQSLKMIGKNHEARFYLEKFQNQIHTPWYRIIIKRLLAGSEQKHLVKLAANKPTRLVVLHTALGLEAEAKKEKKKAEYHYREALGTCLATWSEYDLARARLMNFRKVN